MVYEPFDLASARVLICNDDGIGAPGLKLLEKVMRGLAGEVWVVAPETEQSAASHSLTMRRPLFVRRVSGRRFTVDGTPTDCVLLAVHRILKGTPPDLVLSGINRGGNLGEDAIYSGTVAAAREGALLGFPSVALSQAYEDGQAVRWSTAERWTGEVLRRLVASRLPRGVVLNVNFPDVPAAAVTGIEATTQGRRKIGGSMIEGVDPRGEPYFWIGGGRLEDRGRAGTDLEAIHRGAVSVTPLALDLTHRPTVESLKAALR
ncbi:MAG: 5'/3'-nucleotidase SurE [Rhodospirillales bacterium]